MIDISHFLVVPVLLAGAVLIKTERRRALDRRLDALKGRGFVMSELHDRAHPVVAVDRDNGRVAMVTPTKVEILALDGDDLPAPVKACLRADRHAGAAAMVASAGRGAV